MSRGSTFIRWVAQTIMPFPDQDYNKRDASLPSGCKDLADLIKREQALASQCDPEPPITRHILLPEKISIKYLAEIVERDLAVIIADLVRLRCYLGKNRSIDFEDAVRLLRKYGVAAEKQPDSAPEPPAK
jgi:hypothetical protein